MFVLSCSSCIPVVQVLWFWVGGGEVVEVGEEAGAGEISEKQVVQYAAGMATEREFGFGRGRLYCRLVRFGMTI